MSKLHDNPFRPDYDNGAPDAGTPTPRTDDWIDFAIRQMCEIPDRNSLEDFPEALIVTADEIRNAIECWLPDGAAKPAEKEMVAWQPIETAPKDRNMLLSDGASVCQGGWISDLDQGAEYEGQIGMANWWSVDGIEKPTHWIPLPKPPAHAAITIEGYKIAHRAQAAQIKAQQERIDKLQKCIESIVAIAQEGKP